MSDNPLDKFFEFLNSLHTVQRELAAIWYHRPIITANHGMSRKIEAGDLVRIEDGKLADCGEGKPATHKIILCMGTLYNNFELTLTDIKTNEPLILKL